MAEILFLRVSDLFSNIENEELDVMVVEILSYHPNTGYKMMLGHLNAEAYGFKVSEANLCVD